VAAPFKLNLGSWEASPVAITRWLVASECKTSGLEKFLFKEYDPIILQSVKMPHASIP
jgi:hypothetical protein